LTEVFKPGANSKVAATPYVSNSKLQTVPIFFTASSNFKIGLKVPTASTKLEKNGKFSLKN